MPGQEQQVKIWVVPQAVVTSLCFGLPLEKAANAKFENFAPPPCFYHYEDGRITDVYLSQDAPFAVIEKVMELMGFTEETKHLVAAKYTG